MVNSKTVKRFKTLIHEEYIDFYWKAGIPRSEIYRKISSKLGYSFHCADLNAKSNFNYILKVVDESIGELVKEFNKRG